MATGKARRDLAGHRGQVNGLVFSGDGKLLVSGGDDTTGLVWDLTGTMSWGNEPPEPLNGVSLAACWEDLHRDDAAKAYFAVRRLIADPARAVPYLGQRLRPTDRPDEKRVARLVADLDSDDFAVRDLAVRELEEIGEVAMRALCTALAGKPALEMRRRAEQLVQKLDALTAERLRQIRAVEALEYIASPPARKFLEELAQGAAGARQAQEAKASVERLSKRAVTLR